MSYTELESGYQDLKQANRPGFFLGHDGNGDMDMCGESNDGMDSDCSISSNSGKQVIVGVCAMSKKTQSKPMKEILTRLQEFEYIKMVVFGEDVILKEPVEQWPTVDCLISFHSKGFPLEKAIQYSHLRTPYVINNLHMQYDIQDRRRVYAILEKEGIEIPRYAVLDRDSPQPKLHELIESEDHVEVNGIIFNKPFVEKPVSAEDHNIYIYYPTSAGGGSQRLFRKIGSRSSVYSPESRVRKTGSFIYEDFMPTDGMDIKVYTVGPEYAHSEGRRCPVFIGNLKQTSFVAIGTDVKVYTVGPDYAHAEARKSPALDGKVERDSEGKEIRYPVILNNSEKLISRKVCLAFKQTVCGFDLLRANGKSYVCDVNGFSFVKNSNKYYDDCAKILGNMILRELTPALHIPWSVPFQLDDPPIVPTTFGKMMELRCVVAVIRHGDRTPKQKMKVEVRHPKFFEIFEKYDGYKHGHVKLKRPKQLQEILDIARALLSEIQTKSGTCEIEEKQGKLEQLKSVLEMYGHFSGINRKVQMKYQPKGRPRGSSSDDGNSIKPYAPKEPSLVLILKWGGELTPAGRIQAEELGRIFRCMYPGGQGRSDYSGTQGLGLLRLHSTFRHDLKIYASDEGRVQMTAAAFAKGLLALEGELTPILVQMVKSANTNGLLDNDCDSSKYQNIAKNRLHELMQIDRDFTKEDREAINPGDSISINQAMEFVKNPVKCCTHVHTLIQQLLDIVNIKKADPKTKDAILYHGETWDLMGRRWEKIEKDFSSKGKKFDISKIPDIYDCIKYDLQHNQHTLQYDLAEELYVYAKYLADIVIPQEYGLNIQEKLTIGQGICTPLLKKVKADLQRNIEEVGDETVNRLNPRYSHGVSSPGRHVRTRLYFTSESHVHSLLTVLRYGGLLNVLTDEQWRRAMDYISMVSELNYMSQIVIMLYEDPTKDPSSEERFHVELHFSPGVNCCVQKNLPPGPGFRPHSRNDSSQSKNINPEDGNPTRIDEENDINLEDSPPAVTRTVTEESSPEDNVELAALPRPEQRSKHLKSKPIPIGSHHHTVCGHEAMDLAKRLNEELAAQQSKIGSLEGKRPISPDNEPRSRSYELRHQKAKEAIQMCPTIAIENLHLNKKNSNSNNNRNLSNNTAINICLPSFYKIDTSTNELPLSEIDFSQTPMTPDILLIPHRNEHFNRNFNAHDDINRLDTRPKMSPLATNERPLSCTYLTTCSQAENNTSHYINTNNLKKSLSDCITTKPNPGLYHTNEKEIFKSKSACDINETIANTSNLIKNKSENISTYFDNDDEYCQLSLSYSAPSLIPFHVDSEEIFENLPTFIIDPELGLAKDDLLKLEDNDLNRIETIDKIYSQSSKLKSKSQISLSESFIPSTREDVNLSRQNHHHLKHLNHHNQHYYHHHHSQHHHHNHRVNNSSYAVNNASMLSNTNSKLTFQSYVTNYDDYYYYHPSYRSSTNLNKINTISNNSNQQINDDCLLASNANANATNIATNIDCNDNTNPCNTTNTKTNTIDTTSTCLINNKNNTNTINATTTITTTTSTNIKNDPNQNQKICYRHHHHCHHYCCCNQNQNNHHNHKPHHHPKTLKITTKNPENTTSASSSSSTSSRRQRHSIAGQMTYMKMLGFGGFGKKMATSTNSLFSTAVISGSSSAPNLRDMIPSTATPSAVLEGFGGVPPIRPLETLHNALSLKQLDTFLEKMTMAPLFKTPASSPPKNPSTPVPTPSQTPTLIDNTVLEENAAINNSIINSKLIQDWSKQSPTSTGPSSPMSDTYSHGGEMSTSLTSTEDIGIFAKIPTAEEMRRFFPKLDDDLNSVFVQLNIDSLDSEIYTPIDDERSASCLTPVSMYLDISTAATKGSTTMSIDGNEDDDEATLSAATTPSLPPDDKEISPHAADSLGTFELSLNLHKSIESKRLPRIQKQISLFESGDLGTPPRRLSPPLPGPLSFCRSKFEPSMLKQSASNANFSFESDQLTKVATDLISSRTRSCTNLKSATTIAPNQTPVPGALIVKEIFIEPPKVGNVHTKTQSMDYGLLPDDSTFYSVRASSGSSSPRPRYAALKNNKSQPTGGININPK